MLCFMYMLYDMTNIYGNNVLSDQQIGREIKPNCSGVMSLLMSVPSTTTTERNMTTINGIRGFSMKN